jgi:hypothetical protein
MEAGRDHITVRKRSRGHWKNSLQAHFCKLAIKIVSIYNMKHIMDNSHYIIMFFIMIISGLLSTMNVWVDKISDIRLGLNDLYMILLMKRLKTRRVFNLPCLKDLSL